MAKHHKECWAAKDGEKCNCGASNLFRYQPELANEPQVYWNPKQKGTVCVRGSAYKCLVVSVEDAALLHQRLGYFLHHQRGEGGR